MTVKDEVKIAINGVNIQKYGTLEGELTNIDIGTLTQEKNNRNVDLNSCTVFIKCNELEASDNEIIIATKSMPVATRIIYEKETYLDWMLEMLSFTK